MYDVDSILKGSKKNFSDGLRIVEKFLMFTIVVQTKSYTQLQNKI